MKPYFLEIDFIWKRFSYKFFRHGIHLVRKKEKELRREFGGKYLF